MNVRWPGLMNVSIAALALVAFVCGGHLVATELIRQQQVRQIGELNGIALRRSEAAIEFGLESLKELEARGPTSCEPSALQAVRLHVYRRGVVKDIRVVDGRGVVRCSAYSETLEFDQGWVTRDAMLPTGDPAMRLFRVQQFFGTALGLMKDTGSESGLVAILGINGSLFDIMPAELQDHSHIALELANDELIADSAQGRAWAEGGQVMTIELASDRYPIRTTVQVEQAALAGWNTQPYAPILGLSAFLGLAFGLLLLRAMQRPASPVDELDRAIAAEEFKPFFQPIFELATSRIVGAEILVRWIRSDGSVIPPARFIELAEDSGRIEPITWQLLSSALATMKPVLRRDKAFRISVNITPRQFQAPGFVTRLRKAVASEGIATRQIALEITEREPFPDLAKAAELVREVRSYGFKVAIDDVGIGHSGLSQIQRLGADVLKIDKFFIDCIDLDPSAVIMVEMLVRLAAEMKMSVVAEGIETRAQVDRLLECGVSLGQGYLVSPPVPAEKFLELVSAGDAAGATRRRARAA